MNSLCDGRLTLDDTIGGTGSNRHIRIIDVYHNRDEVVIPVRYLEELIAGLSQFLPKTQAMAVMRPAAQPPLGCACGAHEAEVHRPGCQVYFANPCNAGTLECTACHGKVNSLRSMPNGHEMWCALCVYWRNPPAPLARPAMLEDEDV